MRADNSRHLIKAAQLRTEQTRRQAVAALRRMDATAKPISFESAAANRSRPMRCLRNGNAHLTRPCCAASRSPPNASDPSSGTTASYATRSPKHSVTSARRRSSASRTIATRPTRSARN